MMILSSDETKIFNTEKISRFFIADRDDGFLISVVFSGTDKPSTLSTYGTKEEAKEALYSLFTSMSNNYCCFEMPLSTLNCEERVIKDARTKRRGGS